MPAIRNTGVSGFEGVGMYCSDYALCPHYSVSPNFRGVRREGFHCTHINMIPSLCLSLCSDSAFRCEVKTTKLTLKTLQLVGLHTCATHEPHTHPSYRRGVETDRSLCVVLCPGRFRRRGNRSGIFRMGCTRIRGFYAMSTTHLSDSRLFGQ